MTDEEKKATKILEEFKKTGFYMLSIKYDKDRVHTNKMIENSIETVLNLIQKQEKVIDEMTIYINKNIDVISKDIEDSICCHNKDGKCINRKCEECVIKYFYEKVGE